MFKHVIESILQTTEPQSSNFRRLASDEWICGLQVYFLGSEGFGACSFRVWIGFALGLDWVWFGFGLALDWVWIGFAFFAFFWLVLIVTPYHIQCYSQSARFKIGFVWYKRVISVNGEFLSAYGGQNVKCEMKNVKLWKPPEADEII
jgi:hypothetical protein